MNRKHCFMCILLVTMFSLSALDQDWVLKALSWDTKTLQETVRHLNQEIKKNKNDPELLARAGFCIHQLSQFTNAKVQDGIDYLEKSLEIKDDGLARVFLGSSYTLRAKEGNSLADIDKGMETMDLAVNNNPDNATIRDVRLSNGIAESMPYFIFSKRKAVIEEDLNFLINLYSGNQDNKHVLSELYYKNGIFLLKDNNLQAAVDVWNEVLTKFPDTSGAKKSQEKVLIYDSY